MGCLQDPGLYQGQQLVSTLCPRLLLAESEKFPRRFENLQCRCNLGGIRVWVRAWVWVWGKMLQWGGVGSNRVCLGATVPYHVWPWGGTEVRNLSRGPLKLQGHPPHVFPLGLLCSLAVSMGHFSCSCYPGSSLGRRHLSPSPLLLGMILKSSHSLISLLL